MVAHYSNYVQSVYRSLVGSALKHETETPVNGDAGNGSGWQGQCGFFAKNSEGTIVGRVTTRINSGRDALHASPLFPANPDY